MSVEISLNTPLADALNAAIQPKLLEVGWGTGGADDSALAEYIILMLVNGKTQDQIAADLANDLLSLSPEDPAVLDFAKWLFDKIDTLNAQVNEGSGGADANAPEAQHADAASGDMDTDMNTTNDASELKAPSGPRSMRNGNPRGGREKRMLGHMSRAMDRSNESALHRVRGHSGNERINTHGRAPPTGPRGGAGRPARNNVRGATVQAGLAGMAAGGPQGQWGVMQGQQPSQMDLVYMLEQQNNMMYQLSQQLMNSNNNSGNFGQQRRGGKPLFDRVQHPHQKGNHRNRQNHASTQAEGTKEGTSGDGEDVDMSGNKHDALKAEETVCKYNLHCTNKECAFVHQSPAAPPNTTIDMSNACSFGAACKNRKCNGRHPSPAQRTAHQSEQECKFFPNCQNARCPFKHPSMPLCRNGADCTTPNCKFTHVKTKCKFNPCLNPNCAFAHDAGQQGGFRDKVWTAGSAQEHVSERKFVDDRSPEELVRADAEMNQGGGHEGAVTAQEGNVID